MCPGASAVIQAALAPRSPLAWNSIALAALLPFPRWRGETNAPIGSSRGPHLSVVGHPRKDSTRVATGCSGGAAASEPSASAGGHVTLDADPRRGALVHEVQITHARTVSLAAVSLRYLTCHVFGEG
jgi:hypothetical protein